MKGVGFAAPTQLREYRLDLVVDFEAESFAGHLTIELEAPADRLDLDAAGLTVDAVRAGGRERPFVHDADAQRLSIELPEPAASVAIDYRGAVRRDVLNGFYVSRPDGGKLFTTMFQPNGCRWLMPCVDAPDRKAVFRLTVDAPDGLAVISNADGRPGPARDGRRRWEFDPTPRMATYLVYLGIGPFATREVRYDGTRIVAATPPGKIDRAATALGLAGPILRAYEAYYGLPYPFPKLHLVAVPDFWAGGMENWGAIVFPEVGLLWDETSSPAIVRWAVETLSHEIAHQWFGDLVTMSRWTEIWLNESFATFVSAKMVDQLGLRSSAWSEFLIRAAPGYFMDALTTTHPIRFAVDDPSDISEHVDEITYYKGANVLRMLEGFLGADAFRAGVANYLKRFAFGNAREEELWAALEASSRQPVGRVMASWIERAGHPVVEVRAAPGGLALTQRRFRFAPGEVDEPPWPIPLTVRRGTELEHRLFDTAATTVAVPDGTDAVTLNPGRTAFLRVWYDAPLRAARLARLPALDPFDRWAFLNDAAAFLLAGRYPLADYLAAVRAATAATDYPSVLETSASLLLFRPFLGDLPDFAAAQLAFYRAQAERLTEAHRPGEPDTDAVLRQTVLLQLARLDAATAARLAARFPTIDAEEAALRSAISVAVARVGGAAALDALFERMQHGPTQDAQEQAALALGNLPTTEELARLIERMDAATVRTTYIPHVLVGVARNPAGRDLAWDWLRRNLRSFEKKTEGSWILSQTLRAVLPFVGRGREAEVRAYFERESFPEGQAGVRAGFEMLGLLSALAARAGAADPGA